MLNFGTGEVKASVMRYLVDYAAVNQVRDDAVNDVVNDDRVDRIDFK